MHRSNRPGLGFMNIKRVPSSTIIREGMSAGSVMEPHIYITDATGRFRVWDPNQLGIYSSPYIKRARTAYNEMMAVKTARKEVKDMTQPITKIWKDDPIEVQGLSSTGIGDIWLYFLNEAMVGVASIPENRIYLLRLPLRTDNAQPLLVSHLPPSKDRPIGTTQEVLDGVVADMALNEPEIISIDSNELQEKALSLLSGELVRLIDEKMGLA